MPEQEIPSLITTLAERLSSQEDLELEFKSARGGLPQSLWPTVSAFGNTLGGWIVLGIDHDEATGTLRIEGVSNPHPLIQNLHNALRNPQKINVPVCGAMDVTIQGLGAAQVVVVRVPAAPRRSRPIYINNNPYTGTYVRRHSGDYLCSRQEVERMMREASDVAADAVVLEHFAWDDLDLEAFARYRRRYQTANPTSPWNSYDDKEFLRAIGGFRRDRETGREGITVAGLLLTGKPEALHEWRTRHLIDYRFLPEDPDGIERWADRVVWEGNLLDGYFAVYPRLVGGLPIPFRLHRGRRIDESDVHVVLREALVNLLVHADYNETQPSIILRSSENYLFRNPGDSRVMDTDLLKGNRSDPRNPSLVRMFRLIGLAEEAGTGIPQIIRSWRRLGFRLPAIDVGTERYEFTMDLRLAHLLSEDDLIWLRSRGDHWTEEEQLALVLARHEGYVDNQTLRKLTGKHSSDITKILGNLRDRELLTMSGVGRTSRYQLGPKAQLGSIPLAESSSGGTGTSSGGNGTSSGGNGTSSGGNGTSSGGNGTSSGGKAAGARAIGSTSPEPAPSPDDVEPRLAAIARRARETRRLSQTERDRIVLQLCSITPLSLTELVKLMDRSIDYMHDVLQHLVATGYLEYLYPDQPNHPGQKYIARQSGA